MFKKSLLAATVILAGAANAASAATLQLLDPFWELQSMTLGASSKTLQGFNLNGMEIQFLAGNDQFSDNGLSLVNGPARLTFTYLGSEAGNLNFAAQASDTLFQNGAGGSSFNDTATAIQTDSGLIDFSFGTTAPQGSAGEIRNTGASNPFSRDYAIGYAKISDTSYYLLFDDIAAGDRDFDDLVMRIDVAPIPLPAGGLLLLSGLAGIAAMRRRKKAA